MATIANHANRPRRRSIVPSYANGLNSTRAGWSAAPVQETLIDDVFQWFKNNRAKEGVRPNTEKIYDVQISKFLRWLKQERGYRFYQEVRFEDVQNFCQYFHNLEQYADSSKMQLFRNLRTFFHWIADSDECKQLGIQAHLKALPSIKKIEGRVWIPTPDEVTTFLNEFDQSVIWGFRDYVMSSVMLDCGMRIGELCNIRLDDVEWDRAMLHVPNVVGSKTGYRHVPIDPDVTVPLLRKWVLVRKRYAKGSGQDKLFVSRNGGVCHPNNIAHEFAKHRLKSGVGSHSSGRITPHVLRHYFCTHYLVNGGSIQNLQQITGHTEIETLMIYVHMARQISTVKDEHNRVSPLKKLHSGTEKRKRRMY